MKIRKSHIFLFLGAIGIATVLVAVQYFHFNGIKESLERLVEQKTKGQYKLDLGETSYDFIRLDFTLKDARVYRIDTTNDHRVYAVELPYVRINLGSLESYFSFGQINVKEFVITEPVIVLQKEKAGKQQLRLSAELSNLLHIVKELLDSFNIHSFKIIKGAFTMNREDQTIRIRLIDFLAREWNVRKLTEQSQIRILLGPQNIDIFGHDLSFEQIEYSYSKRQLTVSDFSYHHLDSVTGSRIDAKGKSFTVYHINWEELSSAERYVLKKIEFVNPEINGVFPMTKNKKKPVNFSRMFQDAIGEMVIDSLIVRDARMHLAYKQADDSTSLSFQNASFQVTDFKLLNNNELFEVGEVRVNLNQTELTVGSKYSLRFDSLFFNHRLQRRLYVEGFQLSERNAGTPLLSSNQVIINHFNLFDFLLDKRIKAESLELNGVVLNVSPDQLKKNTSSGKQPDVKIELERFRLTHATIHYNEENRSVTADDLNIKVHGIEIGRSHRPSFNFDQLYLGHLQYVDRQARLEAEAQSISVNEHSVSAKSVVAKQMKGLSALLYNVSLSLDSATLKNRNHLSGLHVGRIHLSGAPVKSTKKQVLPDFSLDQLSVDTLNIDVNVQGNKVNLHALDFNLDGLHLDSANSKWNSIKTLLTDFTFENSNWLVSGGNAQVNSVIRSSFDQLHFFKKDSTVNVRASALHLSAFVNTDFLPSASLIHPTIKWHQRRLSVEGSMDSISVKEFWPLQEKRIGALHVFRPVLQITRNEPKQKQKQRRSPRLHLPKVLEEVFLHHARLTVHNANANPVFVYNLRGQWKQDHYPDWSLDSLVTKTKENRIALSNVRLRPDELSLGTMSIVPLQDFETYRTTGYERDFLTMNYGEVKLKGFVLDSLLFGKKTSIHSAEVGSFQIDALRDKRMPDPAFSLKDLFSTKADRATRQVEISNVQFRNGEVIVREISAKTNETGTLIINNITGEMKNAFAPLQSDRKFKLDATAQVFGQGQIRLKYEVEETRKFKMDVLAERMDFSLFNRMVQPLQSIRFKSGRLKTLRLNAVAGDSIASGTAMINYQDLRIEILKTDKTNFRNELVSAIANNIIRNKRKNAMIDFTQPRDQGKSEFTYWVQIALKGASGAARHGKKQKKITS